MQYNQRKSRAYFLADFVITYRKFSFLSNNLGLLIFLDKFFMNSVKNRRPSPRKSSLVK